MFACLQFFILPFISSTRVRNDVLGYLYRRISLLATTMDEYLVHHDHIWAVLQCVE